MAYDDVITRNDSDELAVRVVSVTEGTNNSSYDDVFTRDTNGKLAVRTVGNGGGGGGDSHNLGYYQTPEALRTAHPTATAGDFAIVNSTDTVWIWDTDTSDWKDGDTKGQVTSVNNQTGAVTVQETLVSGTNIKTVDGNSLLGSGNLELSTYLPYPAGWTTDSTTKAFCDSIAADTTAVKGKAYLGEVTFTDLPASMVNAEAVVEIMDGTTAQDKKIVLSLKSGNVAPYAWQYVYWDNGTNVSGWKTWATAAQGAKADTAVQPADLATVATTGAYSDLSGTPTIPDPTQVSTLPTASADELGNIYQFVGTTDANYTNGYFYKCVSDGQPTPTYSWSNIQVQASSGGLPSQTGNAGKFLTTDGTDASWSDKPLVNRATGYMAWASGAIAGATGARSIALGAYSKVGGQNSIGIISVTNNLNAWTAQDTIAIGSFDTTANFSNKKFYVGFSSGTNGYELVDGTTGTIPADRLVHAINKYSSMPTAASTNEGWIVQYTGTTDSTYTHGHLYECVSDGGNPATYSWTEVQLGGGGSLPSQTGNAGKFLTTNGTDASWTSAYDTYAGGVFSFDYKRSGSSGSFSMIKFTNSATSATNGVTVTVNPSQREIMFYGDTTYTAATLGATKITPAGNLGYPNRSLGGDGIYMSWDKTYTKTIYNGTGGSEITVPATGGTMAVIGVNTTITLTAAGWSSNTQTVNVTGMTATGIVFPSPDPADQSAYTSAGILCTAQAAGTLTFTCTSVPSADIDVNVVML